MAKQTLEEFLDDTDVPSEIRELVKSRLAPEPQAPDEDEE